MRAPLSYEGPVRTLIRNIKYRGETYSVKALASLVSEEAAEALEPGEIVVPVPLHPERLRERGFNQAERIARALFPKGRLRPKALSRRVPGPPQAGLDLKARRRNVRGAFEPGEGLKGRAVLLVDDVITTGATVSECARALKRAGAVRVRAFAPARTVRARLDGAGPPD